MRLLLILLLACWWPAASSAEPFIEVAGGATYFKQYKSDGGRWYQEAFPWSADLKSSSWRIGYGDRINDKWFWTLSWLEIGKNSVVSKAVGDEEYDPVNHRCMARCDNPDSLWVSGWGRGPELAFRRQFENVYLRTGAFLWINTLHVRVEHSFGITEDFYKTGYMLAPFLGAGFRYKLKPVELFAEVTYYHGIGSGGKSYPISRWATVPMAGVSVAF